MKKEWFLRNDYNEKDLEMSDYSLKLDLPDGTTWYAVLHEIVRKGVASYTFSVSILEHHWFQEELTAKNLEDAKKEVENIVSSKCKELITEYNEKIKEWKNIIQSLKSAAKED